MQSGFWEEWQAITENGRGRLESLASDPSGEDQVLRHDGDSLGVDSAEVGVFEEADGVEFSGLLEGEDGGALEAELLLELMGDLPHESMEWDLSDEEIGGLLVLPDFSEGDDSWSISVRLLDTPCDWGALSSGLGCELLSWSLGTG